MGAGHADMKPSVELSELDVAIDGSRIVKQFTEQGEVFRAAVACGSRCHARLEFQPAVESLLDRLAVLAGPRLELPGGAIVAGSADNEGPAAATAFADDKSL
jgi:hypothetical protein